MIPDGAGERRGSAVGMLPALKPVHVVGDGEVEALVRSARASTAKLSLELRALQHEVAVAEGRGSSHATTECLDLPAAHEILRVGIETQLAKRRRELLAELEEARAAAGRSVHTAQVEATALVAAARRELLQILAEAGSTYAEVLPRDDGPATPDGAPPCTDSDGPSVARGQDHVAAPPAALAPPEPARVPGPTLGATPTSEPRTIDPHRAPSFRARFFHADVVLPLIAVFVVFVVLVAWMA